MPRVLVTGFEPFLNYKSNTTQEYLVRCKIQNIESQILPVSYIKVKQTIPRLIKNNYDLIISLGQKETKHIELEVAAINFIHSDKPDNDGNKYFMEKIYKNGPLLHIAKLKPKLFKTVPQLKLSFHAGTYICNALYYCLLHEITTRKLQTRAVFIHIPSKGLNKFRHSLDYILKQIIHFQTHSS